MCKIEHIILVIHYSIYEAVCFQFSQFPRDSWDNMLLCLFIIIKSEVWTIIHCLWLGHETMVCAVCLFVFLWSCDMAGLLRGTFVSWWYWPRICPPVTDMQHYHHVRYPADYWHLACMFPVEVCLVGVFPHSVVIWSDPCVRACVPLMNWRSPSRENNIVQGVTRFSTWAKRGGIWTDARVCLHYWVVIWVAGYCNPPLYCTVFTRGLFGLRVSPVSVCQLLACPDDNSSPVQARIT